MAKVASEAQAISDPVGHALARRQDSTDPQEWDSHHGSARLWDSHRVLAVHQDLVDRRHSGGRLLDLAARPFVSRRR
jgi:hypothetical protein